jgi:RNA polymerase sigma-70 factor (ECF subfamily)
MQRTAGGDRATEAQQPASAASEAFAAAHLDRVFRFAVMVSPPGTDPEDIAQEAMVTALACLNRYDPARGSVDTWLWRIVVSRARDAGRAARRTQVLLERLLTLGHRAPAADSTPEAVVLDRLRDQDLVEAVRRLPSRYRTVIALKYGADLTFPEISNLLGTSRMAVVKTLDRALRRLRKDLEVPER